MPESTAQTQKTRICDAAIPLALFLGSLGLYLRTLCPTVYLGDPGEFCTAIATGGVPHPPGYPLFSLLGRIALALIPYGEPAFRIGCVVALAAAGGVAVLYCLGRELRCSAWAAGTAAALYAVSYTFWSQSTRVEVYSLHVLLAGVALLAGLAYRRTGRHSYLTAAALVGSLGLAHHLTIVLLAPALLVLCGGRLRRDPRPGHRLAIVAAALPVGPALYLLLLVWARAEPLHAWGRTTDLTLLWSHASARIFRIFLAIPDGPGALQALQRAGTLLADNFPYLLFLMPFLGAAALWRRDRGVVSGLLLTVLVVGAYNGCYQIQDISGYYLVVWFVVAALLAVALDAIRSLAPGPARGPLVAGALSVLLVGTMVHRNWGACDLSRATFVREFARQKLESADPNSILITHGDNDINPIWYVHDVLGVRPDVTPIDRTSIGGRTWGLYDRDPSLWYLHRLRRQGIPAPLRVPEEGAARAFLARDGYLTRLLDRELKGRPLCVTFLAPGTEMSRWVQQRYIPVPLGVIVRLNPRNQPIDLPALLCENERLWARISLPSLEGTRTDQEISPDYVVAHYAWMLSNLGGLYEKAGNSDRARALYRRAAAWAATSRTAARGSVSARALDSKRQASVRG